MKEKVPSPLWLSLHGEPQQPGGVPVAPQLHLHPGGVQPGALEDSGHGLGWFLGGRGPRSFPSQAEENQEEDREEDQRAVHALPDTGKNSL